MRELLIKYEGSDKTFLVKELMNEIDKMEGLIEIAAKNEIE